MMNQPPKTSPPKWADRFLEWFLPEHLLEEVQGDLQEVFYKQVQAEGIKAAQKAYLTTTIRYVRPYFFKRRKNTHYSAKPLHIDMFRNYLTIAFRNLQRNKAYTFINVMGLALSITCGILIFTLVTYHLSFDTFHAHSDRIYRFVTEQHRDDISYVASVPNAFGKAFRDDYTFAEKVARIATINGALITVQHGKEVKKFKEAEVAFVESAFFDIFHYPLLEGNKPTVLTAPHTAIITETIARKYFGNENPINQTFRFDNRIDFTITGILKDFPPTTDRQTAIYLSYPTLKTYNEWLGSDDSWSGISSQMQCFALLKRGVNPADVEKVLPAYVKKYRPTSKNVHHYKLQPLADIHFNAHYGGVMEKRNLWVLSLIGLFLIITASVNFINLATAQALKRSKEVGIRKVMGGVPGQLFAQFIAETGLITFFAVLIAYGLSVLTLPYINEWFHSQMAIRLFSDKQLAIFIALLFIVVTFFSGSYPGLILARFQPVLALKGKLSHAHVGGFPLRRALIIAQFSISQMLIIGVIVMASQMHYSKQSDLGFNKDAVVLIPLASDAKEGKTTTLKNQISQITGVENVSLCFGAPASSNNWGTSVKYDSRQEEEAFRIHSRAADEHYLSLFGLQLVVGRNLFASDTAREFIVNESFARKLNLQSPEQLLGKRIAVNGDNMSGTIVGVVKDFHDQSFHEDINAVFITTYPELYNSYAVKISLSNMSSTMANLEKTWSAMHPDQVYEYQFLDEHIAEFYQTEELMLKLIQSFAGIAIFIGCLGLYGLVSFMAVQKVKEIGVRKVLGASVGQIFWLFSREYLLLIGISFGMAAPVAHYFMQQWLNDFSSRISLHVGYYLIALAGSVCIALLSASYQSMKAALTNPMKALRAE